MITSTTLLLLIFSYFHAQTRNDWKIIKQTDSIYLEQIQFINPELGWICGENGKVLQTKDCGRTWSYLSIKVNNGNLLLYGMCFIDDSTGYVSGAVLNENKSG